MTRSSGLVDRVRQRLQSGEYAARHEFLYLKSHELLTELAAKWAELAFVEKNFFIVHMSISELRDFQQIVGNEVLSQEPAELRRLMELAEGQLTPIRRMFLRSSLEQPPIASHVEQRAISLAVEESRNCVGEDAALRPKVGAVVFNAMGILGVGYRGKFKPGQHAEYGLIEHLRAQGAPMAGASIVTTLEPCTTRGHDKFPCAGHIAAAGLTRVLIGSLDPNPTICGHGVLYLQARGIAVELVPANFYRSVLEANRAFISAHLKSYKVDLMRVGGA